MHGPTIALDDAMRCFMLPRFSQVESRGEEHGFLAKIDNRVFERTGHKLPIHV